MTVMHSSLAPWRAAPIDRTMEANKAESLVEMPVSLPILVSESVSLTSRSTSTPLSSAEKPPGLRKRLVGWILAPSQFKSKQYQARYQKKLERFCEPDRHGWHRCETLSIPTKDGRPLKALVHYPPGWDPQKNKESHCVLLNNHLGFNSLSAFFSSGKINPKSLPGFLQLARQCPLVLYDYSGTGFNKAGSTSTVTDSSIVQDGCDVLAQIAGQFGHVETVGTCMGGMVATESLARAVSEGRLPDGNVELVSLDAFTSLMERSLQYWPQFADATHQVLDLDKALDMDFDGPKAMQTLMDHGVKVTVLNNQCDDFVPKPARMSEAMQPFKTLSNVRIEEGGGNHFALTKGFKRALMETAPCPEAWVNIVLEEAEGASGSGGMDERDQMMEEIHSVVLKDERAKSGKRKYRYDYIFP